MLILKADDDLNEPNCPFKQKIGSRTWPLSHTIQSMGGLFGGVLPEDVNFTYCQSIV